MRRARLIVKGDLMKHSMLQLSFYRRPAEIAALIALWHVGDWVVRLTHLPLSGGMVGMALVLALLGSGWLRPDALRLGATWLLAEMLLFFVPAVLSVLNHGELWGWLGLKIVGLIVAGTALVMAATAITVELCCRVRG